MVNIKIWDHNLGRILDHNYCSEALFAIDRIESLQEGAEYEGDPPLSIQEMLDVAVCDAELIGVAAWLLWEGHNLHEREADQILSVIYRVSREEYPPLREEDAKELIKALVNSPQHDALFIDVL